MRTSTSSRWGPLLVVAALVANADLVIKALVERRLSESVNLILGLRLDVGYNSGAAFGVGGDAAGPLLILIVVGLLLTLVVAVEREWLAYTWIGLGLLFGGAIANLVDRIGDERVTDYIDFELWPAFNLADIAITVGVAIVLWTTLSQERATPPGSS